MSKSIVKACVRYNDRLYTGFDHGECFKKLNEDNTIEQSTFTKIVHSEIEQGFVDNDGNFVDRKQAMIIAKESGQLTYETDKQTLISEDLHLNWLNKQAERISELEEQLKNAIVLPRGLKVGDTVYFVDEDGILKGKVVSAIKELDLLETCFVDWFYCVYEDGLTFHHLIKDVGTKLFNTFEEAQVKLEELRGNDVED